MHCPVRRLVLHTFDLLVQAPSRSSEIAAKAKSVATNASNRVQAAAQSAANALSPQQIDPSSLRSPETAAQAKSAAFNASERVQAAAQSAANALSPQQIDPSSLRSSDIAAQAKSAASNASNRVQAAAQSTVNAFSSQQTDPSSSHEHQQGTDDQGRSSEAQDGALSSSTAASGSALERAKHALLLRIAMVTDKYRDDDCTCFDTTLGSALKVSNVQHCVVHTQLLGKRFTSHRVYLTCMIQIWSVASHALHQLALRGFWHTIAGCPRMVLHGFYHMASAKWHGCYCLR